MGTDRTTLRGPPNRCRECNGEYQRLGRHWTSGDCDPQLTDRQDETLIGLALAGANIEAGAVRSASTDRDLVEWTAAQLDWLVSSVSRVDDAGADSGPIYQVATATHGGVARYERWTGGPPIAYRLTPHAARVWWAHAGGLQWQGDYDSQATATISALDDDRAAWIQRVLATAGPGAGIDATRVGTRVQWHGQQVRDWLDWIGDPVPGVAHKWALEREAYDELLREEA